MTVWICETRSPLKAPEDRYPDLPIRARFQKTTSRIVQSDYSGRTNKSDRPIRALPTDHLPYQPIRALLRTICPYRPIRSFRRTFLRTIFPYRPIRSFGRTFLRTIFLYQLIRSFGQTFLRTIFPYRPIRSFGRTFLQTIFRLSQSDRSDSYQTVIHCHSLRSHPQYRMVRHSRLSRLRAKAVAFKHKLFRAHKSLTRKAVFNHTQ